MPRIGVERARGVRPVRQHTLHVRCIQRARALLLIRPAPPRPAPPQPTWWMVWPHGRMLMGLMLSKRYSQHTGQFWRMLFSMHTWLPRSPTA